MKIVCMWTQLPFLEATFSEISEKVLLKLLVYVHHPRLCDLLTSTLSTVIVPILSHSLEWCAIDHLSVLEQHFYCNSPCCCSTEISSIQK